MAMKDSLEKLYSDKSRLTFLKGRYTPGNREVADLILSINPKAEDVLESEIDYARKHGQNEEFVELAKKLVNSNYDDISISLKEKVIAWRNPEVADYVLRKFRNGDRLGRLEIEDAFGRKSKEKCLEELLEIQKNGKYPWSGASTAIELGRYDEAIDLYLRSSKEAYGWFGNALDVAKKYNPQRLKEVAQEAFDIFSFTQESGFFKIFAECAELVDKTEEAKKIILKEAEKVMKNEKYYNIRSYEELVDPLVKFGCITQAQELVAHAKKKKGRVSEGMKELAKLFELVGETAKARSEYLELADEALKGKWHPSNVVPEIDRAYMLTGDKTFLDKKLQLYEVTEHYDEASQLATQMGNNELAEIYKAMARK